MVGGRGGSQVGDMAMLPQKETRELLYRMMRAGFIKTQVGPIDQGPLTARQGSLGGGVALPVRGTQPHPIKKRAHVLTEASHMRLCAGEHAAASTAPPAAQR